MAKGDEKATFSVILDDQVSAGAVKASDSVETLSERMKRGEQAVKDMSTMLRKLRGSTDEVKKAKEALKARINAEKDAISSATLAQAKAKVETGRLAEAKKSLSKMVTSLRDRFGLYGERLETVQKGASILKTAVLGLAAAAAAATVAAAGAVIALAKWTITGANAARSTALLREAIAGNAKDGEALGSQVDALAAKVPIAKAELNELANEMVRGGLRGQQFVDTLNAVGQASAALGNSAGSKLQSLVERGRTTQRFSVGDDTFSEDLRGTGLQRDDVAKALAKNMKVGVAQARQALAEGRVKLGDGAKALRDAVEQKFGKLNLRKMLDLNVIGEKIHERLAAMTSGVNLEPLLKGFDDLANLFDESTVSGSALKELITVFGNNVVKGFEKGIPLAKQFFKGLVIGALQAGVMFLQLRNYLKKTFADNETLRGLFSLETALKAGKTVAGAMLVAFGLLAAAIAGAVAGAALLGGFFQKLTDIGVAFGDFVRGINWGELGVSIVDGLVGGLKSAASRAVNGAKDLAESIKGGFKDALGIHSPSKVFAGYGENTAEGYAQGVDSGTPAAAKSLDNMASPPAQGGGRARGAVSISMPITITVQGGSDVAKQLTDEGFLKQLTSALRDVLISQGIPIEVS